MRATEAGAVRAKPVPALVRTCRNEDGSGKLPHTAGDHTRAQLGYCTTLNWTYSPLIFGQLSAGSEGDFGMPEPLGGS